MDLFPGPAPDAGIGSEEGEEARYVASPCVGICSLDDRGVCEGCLRTGAEIAAWASLSPDAQRRLLNVLSARWAELGL